MSLGSAFEVGDWRVEPDLLRIRRGAERRKLEPMAMRVLVYLAERPGEVISRSAILDEVWDGRTVVDETLSRAISLVRQALGDKAQSPRYVETIPKRGYRLIAPVRSYRPSPSRPSPSRSPPSRTWWLVILAVLLLALVAWWRSGRDRASTPAAPESGSTIAVPASQRPGIAVLPFKNLSTDPENAYLAEGLTEELIHQLASVSGLRVVSRTSSMRFRDSEALAPEIARALNVEYLLEGTVLVVGRRLRITAQLIRPDQDDHLLSRSYDRDLSEVLDLQREVAKDVAEHTRITLSPTEATRLSRNRPVRSDAYRAYLQGQQWVGRRAGIDRGLERLENAVELDPGFAPAWSALADAHLLSSSYLGVSEEEAYAGAEAAIDKALELDPELAAAHASLGLLRLQRDRDWAGSEASYRRAIALEPSYVTARQWYSELLSILGRHEEAVEQVNLALALDPLSPLVHAAAGQRLNAAGRHEEALSRFRDVEALGADFSWHFREGAWALERLGRLDEALETHLEGARRRLSPDHPRIVELERALREEGLSGFYRWELENLEARERRGPGYPTWRATAHAGRGETEAALAWLAKAARRRNLWLLHTLKSPAFDDLRDDPRFEEALGDLPPWRPEVVPPR